MQLKEVLLIYALAQRVLAVAVVNYNQETKELFDWAVYCDAVQGYVHSQEKVNVGLHGDKLMPEIAKVLFPHLTFAVSLDGIRNLINKVGVE